MPRKKPNKLLRKAAKDSFPEIITKNTIKDDCFGKVPQELNTPQALPLVIGTGTSSLPRASSMNPKTGDLPD